MIKCVSHKKVYLNQEIAEEALIGARTRFDYGKQSGPIGVYQCDDCGYYHLTSQGIMNPKLEAYLSSNKFKYEKEAQNWIDKLNRR